MSVTGHVELDQNSTSDPESVAWGVPLSPLSISVDAELTDSSSGAFVIANGTGDASWGAGGNSGSVLFRGYGWRTVEGASHYEADLNGAGPDWQYTFTADANGTFSMTYVVTASHTKTGLYGWNIGWSGPGGDLNLQNALDPATSGVFTRALSAGTDYTVTLDNNAHIFSDTAFATGLMDGTFNFKIATVPEPGTLGLLATALAGFAAFRRRRRRARKLS